MAVEQISKAANFSVLISVPQLPPYSPISKRSTLLLPPQPGLSVLHHPLPPGGSQDIPAVQIENLQGSSFVSKALSDRSVLVMATRWQKWYSDECTTKLLFLGQELKKKKKSLSNFNSTLHVFNSVMPIIPVYGSLQCY